MLADFNNTTGDAVFDDTLKQAISAQLGQSPFLNILSDARTRATLRLMAKPREYQADTGGGDAISASAPTARLTLRVRLRAWAASM